MKGLSAGALLLASSVGALAAAVPQTTPEPAATPSPGLSAPAAAPTVYTLTPEKREKATAYGTCAFIRLASSFTPRLADEPPVQTQSLYISGVSTSKGRRTV